jgi:hypothetical protein
MSNPSFVLIVLALDAALRLNGAESEVAAPLKRKDSK